ncbi:MAG: ParB/RepB/Spo0J family partition protein [Candidatus Berkiellales bacterium]
MTIKKRGLGKGLNELLAVTFDATLSEQAKNKSTALGFIEDNSSQQTLTYLPIEKLISGPFQPRQHIRHEGLEQLAESIRAQGVLQPIVVRHVGDHYEIVAGERRWRAAQLAGLTTVPTIVRQVPDEAAMAMALIENIQREDLNPVEEALALKRLSEDLQLTHLQVAEAVGKSRTSVTNLLRLLTLNPDVQTLLEEEQLEMGHARALLGLKGTLQSQVAQTILKRGLSVREAERLVAKLRGESVAPRSATTAPDPNISRLEEDLAEKLGAQVMIRHGRQGRGMVVIHYHSVDELEGILAHFK